MVAKTMQGPVLSTQTGSTILLFILPLVAVRLALQPVFPLEHDWADFQEAAPASRPGSVTPT